MSVAARTLVPEQMRTSIIRVTGYDDKNMQGTFYNPHYGTEIAFGNMTRLLLLMEDMMDEQNCPQAAVQSRRFGKEQKAAERETLTQGGAKPGTEPAMATFQIKVTFRQNATWQGLLTWEEGGKQQNFRSALELIKLLDSALPQPELIWQTGSSEQAM